MRPRAALQVIVPALGSVRSAMRRKSVLLPQPEGPRIERNDPASTLRFTSWSAVTPFLNILARPAMSSSGAALILVAQLVPDALVDEAQRVGAAGGDVRRVEPLPRHRAGEILPPRIRHRAQPIGDAVAAVDDAVPLH